MERLKYSYLVAKLCEVGSACKSRRTGADDCYLYPVRLGLLHIGCLVGHIVRAEALKSAYSNRLSLDSSYALALALIFLRAYSSANGGKSVCKCYNLVGSLKVAFLDLRYKLRNVYSYRTAADARHVFAVKASVRFIYCLLRGIALADLLEVSCSYLWILLLNRSLGILHIRHV